VLPAFFINGRYLGGAKPYDTFQQAIEYVMAADK
jgi:predicted DsbA family dithiol-disulfide isomerase